MRTALILTSGIFLLITATRNFETFFFYFKHTVETYKNDFACFHPVYSDKS